MLHLTKRVSLLARSLSEGFHLAHSGFYMSYLKVFILVHLSNVYCMLHVMYRLYFVMQSDASTKSKSKAAEDHVPKDTNSDGNDWYGPSTCILNQSALSKQTESQVKTYFFHLWSELMIHVWQIFVFTGLLNLFLLLNRLTIWSAVYNSCLYTAEEFPCLILLLRVSPMSPSSSFCVLPGLNMLTLWGELGSACARTCLICRRWMQTCPGSRSRLLAAQVNQKQRRSRKCLCHGLGEEL